MVRVLAALAVLIPAISQTRDPPEYREAVQLVEQQNWSAALERLKKLTAEYPHNAKVGNLLGLAYLGSGDSQSALASFERTLRDNPAFAPALKNLAILEWSGDGAARKRAAAEHTAAALKLNPRDPVLNACAAIAALEQKHPEEARRRLELVGDARSVLPPELALRLGVLLGEQGLYRESSAAFGDLLARGYDSPSLRYNLGLAEYLGGDYAAAIRTLEEVRSRNPSADSLNVLAHAYAKSRRTQQAIDTLREAAGLDPTGENNYLDLANLCMDSGAYSLASEVIQAGLEHVPGSAKLRFELGLIRALSGDFPAAQAEFERAAELEPRSDLPAAAMELAAIQQSRLPEAIRDLREKVRRNNGSGVLWYLLGAALIRGGAQEGDREHAEAVAAFQQAMRCNPRLLYPYIELAKIYQRADRVQDSLPLLERARELAPSAHAPYYLLASAYRKLDQPKRAGDMLARLQKLMQHERENAFQYPALTKQ